MLIGMNSKKTQTMGANADIFDVSSASFEATALKESMERPVLMEFWAPWCGPCKQLMPILEKVTLAKAGQIALAKVNIDENPELAEAFRVQSVPMVVVLYQGQPVTGFAGVRPVGDIERLVDQLIAMHSKNKPPALDIPATLKEAALLLAAGDVASAKHLYEIILAEEAEHLEAYVGLVRTLIAAGQMDDADMMIRSAPETLQKDGRFTAAKTAYQLACNTPEGDIATAEKTVTANPEDPAAQYHLAELYYAAGAKEKAADALLASLRINRIWDDGKAKKQILTYLEAWGFADPISVETRRKLSTLLFS